MYLLTSQRKASSPTDRGAEARTVDANAAEKHARNFRERGPRPGEPPMNDSGGNVSATLPCLQGNVARVGGGDPSFFCRPLESNTLDAFTFVEQGTLPALSATYCRLL